MTIFVLTETFFLILDVFPFFFNVFPLFSQRCQLSVTNKQKNMKNFFEGDLLTVPMRDLECVFVPTETFFNFLILYVFPFFLKCFSLLFFFKNVNYL